MPEMREMKNQFSRRYQLTLDRVRKTGTPAYTPEMVVADVIPRHERRFTEFSGDVSGRYLGALACAARTRSESYPELARVASEVVSHQKPQGYFGGSFAKAGIQKEDMALLWGNGRLLIGLLEYYATSRQKPILDAATKLGDFLVRIAPDMNSDRVRRQFEDGAFAMGYICWTQIIEGLAELHRVTGSAAYRQVAESMAERTERRPNEHSHGFLTSVRGILALYDVTGDRRFLDRARQEWQGVIGSGNVLVPGSVPEAWKPKAHRTEGCSEADWLRLSLGLWGRTREPGYLAHAERTLFNEFAMNQFDSGDFGHRVISRTGFTIGGNEEGGGTARAWWCCTLHGLRAFPDVLAHVFRVEGDALAYDLPVEGRGELGEMRLAAESSLEQSATVRLVVESAKAGSPVMIREPGWVYGLEIAVNGLRLATLNRNGYHRLSQPWKAGDVISVRYILRTRGELDPATGRWALWHGPWLLGAEELANPHFFDEPHHANLLDIRLLPSGDADLDPDQTPDDNPFAVQQARFRVRYLPGGYPMFPSTVTLRPIAEQTGHRPSAWEYLFRIQGERQG